LRAYAYVTLRIDQGADRTIARQLVQGCAKRSPDRRARPAAWAPNLPKTRSGKIMRRILRKIAADEHSQLASLDPADPTVVDDLVNNRMNRVG